MAVITSKKIVLPTSQYMMLSDFSVGSEVLINENGSPVCYYVKQHGYVTGRTLLVRKGIAKTGVFANGFDLDDPDAAPHAIYEGSIIDNYMNSTFPSRFSSYIRNLIATTNISCQYVNYNSSGYPKVYSKTISRVAFALSGTEITSLSVNPSDEFWSRDTTETGGLSAYYAGKVSSGNVSYDYETGYLPAFTLPSNVKVHIDSTTVKEG